MNQQSGSIKSLILRGFGPVTVGRMEYLLRPSLRASWGGPMNGQAGRMQICRDIIAALPPKAIVETGTFRGTTTEFFASFGLPVYSVEFEPRYHAFAQMRLRAQRDRVHLTLADSRSFLKKLANDASVPKDSVFFYLDAHWNADLPLAEEITTIFGTWSRAVIMIDDFAVPGDSYSYDDYGPGAALDADYLDALKRTDMSRFYPSLRAYQETGAKRGSIVLCNDAGVRDRLLALKTLRPA
jgi:predicted O-methyltransferase YrrM